MMQNQSAITIPAKRTADEVRRGSDTFALSVNVTPEARAIRKLEIERCADMIEASRTGAEYEAAVTEARRLGAFPSNGAVAQAACADVRYAD
jgi:hypothetical protein